MRSLEKQKRIFITLSLLIPMTLLVGFVVFPAFDLIRMSFTDWDGYSAGWNMIWLDNYVSMLKNEDLWLSLRNNAVYFFGHLLFIPIELLFAVLLTSKLRAAKFYKTMVFMPYIINGVAISYAFSYFFSPINGAFDAILSVFHLDFVLFDNIRGALQVFDIPYVMTSGGPGYASSTFTLYTIDTAFKYSNFGLASTMAVAIMIMIVVIYVVQDKIIHGLVLRRDKE